jgi:hypothetical protein
MLYGDAFVNADDAHETGPASAHVQRETEVVGHGAATLQ